MRIVQTFWTAGQDPLKHSFGWSHPQYNLMSWALSCLSLREHYDDVELYTDSAGYHILIEVLGLPYTKTHVVFDDFKCLPHHWALAKIKTYSMQTEPFIHVDGDIYVPKPLPKDVEDAPLVAQNREIGTSYYKWMMDCILSYKDIIIPDYIKVGLSTDSVASYNMGMFGGKDIEFIHDYCAEVFLFMDSNSMNDSSIKHSAVDCNVFFEQVMFAVLADISQRQVFNILGRPMIDEGYMAKDFCALRYYEEKPFFHILGGHKRNQGVSNMIEGTLIRKYPKFYHYIAKLFYQRHSLWLESSQVDEILLQEQKISSAFLFIDASSDQKDEFVISINPLLEFIKEDGQERKARRSAVSNDRCTMVSYKELAENIILILRKEATTYKKLRSEILQYFLPKLTALAENLMDREMTYLLINGIITAECTTN